MHGGLIDNVNSSAEAWQERFGLLQLNGAFNLKSSRINAFVELDFYSLEW